MDSAYERQTAISLRFETLQQQLLDGYSIPHPLDSEDPSPPPIANHSALSSDAVQVADTRRHELAQNVEMKDEKITAQVSATPLPADPSIPPASGRCCLLELPRELRDNIWEKVLIPQEQPIEFAPLPQGENLDRGELFYWWVPGQMYDEGQGWYFSQYDKVRMSLKLLRVNKQINFEATPIYYGQPFRFSNRVGWIVLWHWMLHIGPKNLDLVKDITVCHPALTVMPTITGNLQGLADSLLEYYGMDSFIEQPHCVSPTPKLDSLLGPDPRLILQSMQQLRHLRLLADVSKPEQWKEIVQDPIHGMSFWQPRIERSIVNFISTDDYTEPRLATFTLAMLDEGPKQWRQKYMNKKVLVLHYTNSALKTAGSKGWQAEEMVYDRRYQYPVSFSDDTGINSYCINPAFCKYVATCLSYSIPHKPCSGIHGNGYYGGIRSEDDAYFEKAMEERERENAEHEKKVANGEVPGEGGEEGQDETH